MEDWRPACAGVPVPGAPLHYGVPVFSAPGTSCCPRNFHRGFPLSGNHPHCSCGIVFGGTGPDAGRLSRDVLQALAVSAKKDFDGCGVGGCVYFGGFALSSALGCFPVYLLRIAIVTATDHNRLFLPRQGRETSA